MAVKVGNSWVSEAALSYAKVKADSGESATLNGLLDRSDSGGGQIYRARNLGTFDFYGE